MGLGLDTVFFAYMGCIALLIFVRHPSWLLYPMIIVPIFGLLRDGTIPLGPVNVYAKDLLLAVYFLAVAAFLFKKARNRSKFIDVPDDARLLVLLILTYIFMHMAFMVLAFLRGLPLDSAIRRFLIFADCLYFFFPIFFLRDTRKIRNVILFLACISVLYLGWQMFMYALSGGVGKSTSSGTVRLTGSHVIPLLGCGIFILILWGGEIRGYVFSIFPIMSILLIGHRSGYLAVAMGLLLFFSFTRKIGKGMLYTYCGLFLIVVSLIGMDMFSEHTFLDDTTERIADTFSSTNPTTVGRFYSIKNNFFVFRKKPITGIGYNHESLRNMFPPSTSAGQKQFITDEHTIGARNVLAPHNFVTRLLSHTGIIGTFLIFSIIGLVLKRCYSFIRADGILRDLGIFLFCSIVFFLIIAIMNTTFVSLGWVFWVLCGASVIFSKNEVADIKF